MLITAHLDAKLDNYEKSLRDENDQDPVIYAFNLGMKYQKILVTQHQIDETRGMMTKLDTKTLYRKSQELLETIDEIMTELVGGEK